MHRRRALASTALAFLLGGAPPGGAHVLDPEQVVAEIRRSARDADFAVLAAAADRALPRLLVVAVDARWAAVPAERRRRLAEAWRVLWRESAYQGVLAVTDARGASLVTFDADGHARLRAPAAP